MIRTGETRARVAGIFDVREQSAIRRLLEPSGLEVEDGELLVEREILAGGKSRAFVGSRPVSVSLLKDLAPFLADIHGQHDQQLLFSPDAQREMLDAFGNHRELVERIDSLFGEWRAAAAELEELERSEQEKLRLLDLWSFQRKEIESADLEPDEEAALENERRVLQNVQRLEEAATAAYTAIYDGRNRRARWCAWPPGESRNWRASMPRWSALREHLKAADLSLQEVSYALRDYLGRLEANPGRLEEVELRLAGDRQAEAQVRPVGCRDPQFPGGGARGRSRWWRRPGERMEALRQGAEEAGGRISKSSAAELTARRNAAARKLEKRVEEELAATGHGAHRVSRADRSRAMVARTARTGWSFWCRRMWAKSRERWRRWRRAARFRASRWR